MRSVKGSSKQKVVRAAINKDVIGTKTMREDDVTPKLVLSVVGSNL